MFNEAEKQLLADALEMAKKSNARMQNSKPKFAEIFKEIDAELTALDLKIKQSPTIKK